MSPMLSAFIALFFVGCADARYRPSNLLVNTDTFCSCSALAGAREANAVAYKGIKNIIETTESIFTVKNCPEGHEFKYDENLDIAHYTDVIKKDIVCTKCRENYYRNSDYTMCRQCPVGYYSNAGDSECKKADINTKDIHRICNEGFIIGNDKFADVYNSCHMCSPQKKEYMPFKNIMDKCQYCPDGSIVDRHATTCTECPIGTYEKNNECIECEIGSYADKNNTAGKCSICNNPKALSYTTAGGITCDDSIFYEITKSISKNVANVVNMDAFIKPLAYGANMGFAAIYNNRKMLAMLTHASIPIIGVAAFVGML